MIKKIIGFSVGTATLGAGVATAIVLNRTSVTKPIENTKIQEKTPEIKEPERLVQARQAVLSGKHRCVEQGEHQVCYPEEEAPVHS